MTQFLQYPSTVAAAAAAQAAAQQAAAAASVTHDLQQITSKDSSLSHSCGTATIRSASPSTSEQLTSVCVFYINK